MLRDSVLRRTAVVTEWLQVFPLTPAFVAALVSSTECRLSPVVDRRDDRNRHGLDDYSPELDALVVS